MNMTDIIGTIGVGLILLAYFLNIFNLLSKENKVFFLLNIAGAGLACYASWMIDYWPFVVLEGTWFLVSVAGFLKIAK
jgi:hypothetical protein